MRVEWGFIELGDTQVGDPFGDTDFGAILRLASPKTSHALCCGMTDVWYLWSKQFWCAYCFLPCGIVSEMQPLWYAYHFSVSDNWCVRYSLFCLIQSISITQFYALVFGSDFVTVFWFWVLFYCQIATEVLLDFSRAFVVRQSTYGYGFFKWTWAL